MIQKKILWGEPERSLREAQRRMKHQQQCLKAQAQARAGAADPTALAMDLLLNDLAAVKAVADA